MKIEVVTIGDELLFGKTVNSNLAWMGRHLAEAGYEISKHTTLPDERTSLLEGLSRALLHADVVITTGGLGPTGDDLSKQIAADLFSSPLEYQEKVACDLNKRFGNIPSLKNQATLPSKATFFENPLGTAYGLCFSEQKKTLILLPGVPLEMEAIFTASVLPYLKKQFPVPALYQKTLHFSILYESLVDPLLRTLQDSYPDVTLGIYPDYGHLSVSIRARTQKTVDSVEKEFMKTFSPYVFASPSGKLAEAVQLWFLEHQKTLGIAESCTGGMISSLITEISGSSGYFLGSLVTYSNAWKESLLHVSSETLQKQGAVSAQVVEQMLQGIFQCSSADYGIAVSGIVGPTGGTEKKPEGTIWAAIGQRGKPPEVGQFFVKGNRKTRILSTANILLGALLRKVSQKIPAFPIYLK